MITQKRLKDLFQYDDGALIRLISTCSNRKVGERVYGFMASKGRKRIMVDNVRYPFARIIWIWHFGAVESAKIIDHIDGNPSNNKIENLRVVDGQAENMQNKIRYTNNTTGCPGVHLLRGQYVARIQINKKRIFLGTFALFEDAKNAYLAAKAIYHPIQPTVRLL